MLLLKKVNNYINFNIKLFVEEKILDYNLENYNNNI